MLSALQWWVAGLVSGVVEAESFALVGGAALSLHGRVCWGRSLHPDEIGADKMLALSARAEVCDIHTVAPGKACPDRTVVGSRGVEGPWLRPAALRRGAGRDRPTP